MDTCNSKTVTFLPFTPGHACGLQTLLSRFPPIAEQSVPPLSGSGFVQFLVLT